MKTLIFTAFTALVSTITYSQSLVGTWQLTDEKTCFQNEMDESETERELKGSMSGSRNSVARILIFTNKGTGEEGIAVKGKKKLSNATSFLYRLTANQLLFVDKKSQIATQQLIVDELTETTLRLHNARKECETRTFIRVN